MIGGQLEKAGWRQGTVVKSENIKDLLDTVDISYEEGLVLLVASQSCDIANNNIESDPYIELSLGRVVSKINGNLAHNKNPRLLHTVFTCRTEDAEVFSETPIEFKAFEKIAIPKGGLVELLPDQSRVLEEKQLKSYVAWLAARYSRPALPTAFNERLKSADPKDKLRGKVKKGNEQLSGIYVEIIPDAEISGDESYHVNLLGLLPAGFDGDHSKAKSAIDVYADVMRRAGMDVLADVSTEDSISIAVITRFKRFYYDDLSFRDDAPLPPETKTIL